MLKILINLTNLIVELSILLVIKKGVESIIQYIRDTRVTISK